MQKMAKKKKQAQQEEQTNVFNPRTTSNVYFRFIRCEARVRTYEYGVKSLIDKL